MLDELTLAIEGTPGYDAFARWIGWPVGTAASFHVVVRTIGANSGWATRVRLTLERKSRDVVLLGRQRTSLGPMFGDTVVIRTSIPRTSGISERKIRVRRVSEEVVRINGMEVVCRRTDWDEMLGVTDSGGILKSDRMGEEIQRCSRGSSSSS